MRVLDEQEIEQVSGGFAPIIAAVASFATHHAVRSVGQYYLSRGLSAYAIYSIGRWASAK
ncbi:MAG: hypothetical protein ACJAR0_004524 [Candidatus Azotimanducaceae bacterium]|jgi:hypothetical protein